MSHFVQRKEKDCLNCGTIVHGRYCHVCGQENIEPKETFGHLVTHFFYDVTHFDGKFFSSVKYLLFKPGFLSKEYVRGKRMAYLNPIRMYVFVSAFFFLFFFSVVVPNFNTSSKENENLSSREIKEKISARIETLEKELKENKLSDMERQTDENKVVLLQQDLQTLAKDTTHLSELNYYNHVVVTIDKRYSSLGNYDSVQNALPEGKRDSWFKRMTVRRALQAVAKYQRNNEEFTKTLYEKYRHYFPQLLFVSLPLFALLLKLLYVRRRNFFYVDHIIYSVHLYCAVFIFMFLMMVLSLLQDFNYLHWLQYISLFLSLYVLWYIFRSMKNFYNQGVGKTILKFLLLLLLSLVMMTALFFMFFIFSIYTA